MSDRNLIPRADEHCDGYREMLGAPGLCSRCHRFVEDHNPITLTAAKEPSGDDAAKASALVEAQRLVHGQRNKDYGSPAEDWGRIASMARALFGWEMTAADAALFMILVKVSRERNRPKRDNRVDIAGYAEVVDWIHRDTGDEKGTAT